MPLTDAELEALVQDVRPRPDPQWAARLDARAAAGFPEPPRRRRRWRWPSLPPVLLPAVGVACILALIGGTVALTGGGSGGDQSSSGSGGGGAGVAERASGPSRAASSSGAPAAPAAPQRRFVERSAQLELSTAPGDVEDVADGVVRATDTAGGFVAYSTVSTGAHPRGSFELRIPERRLGSALAELSQLAHVRSRVQSAQDITDVVSAARARLKDLQAEQASLRRRLALAVDEKLADRLRGALARVGRRVDAARRSLAGARQRAVFATVAVTVVGDRHPSGGASGGQWTPGDALRDAGRVLEVAAGVALVALAVALPVGLVGALGWAALRVGARRRRERLLDMA